MVDMVKQTPAYKNKLKALELERNGGFTSKKKAPRNRRLVGFLLLYVVSNFVMVLLDILDWICCRQKEMLRAMNCVVMLRFSIDLFLL